MNFTITSKKGGTLVIVSHFAMNVMRRVVWKNRCDGSPKGHGDRFALILVSMGIMTLSW